MNVELGTVESVVPDGRSCEHLGLVDDLLDEISMRGAERLHPRKSQLLS